MAMRIFGKNVGPVFAKKPTSFAEIQPSYLKHKKYIYNVKEITLSYPKKGNGITATRYR